MNGEGKRESGCTAHGLAAFIFRLGHHHHMTVPARSQRCCLRTVKVFTGPASSSGQERLPIVSELLTHSLRMGLRAR